MRADRLLSIMLLLQVHRRLTARKLAERLEVSERTIHRDMDALSGAGIPVVAERGQGGGWSLLEPYRTNLTGLNLTEVQALFLAQPPSLLADLGLEKPAEAALIKLLATLPPLQRRDADFIRQRIHLDATSWHPSPEDLSALPALQQALWQECKVRLVYRRSDGTEVERLIDPLGLVAKGSVWYLVAAVEGAVRTYRVSRVQAITPTEEAAERPAGFDLATYWQQSLANFVAGPPRYPVTVRIDPDILPFLKYASRLARIERIGQPEADSWLTVSLQFDVIEEACAYVLGFGPQMEVLEPAELRQMVIRKAEATVAFYTRPANTSQ
jgi:predicted DNA-binding transcriptional regulator YafY